MGYIGRFIFNTTGIMSKYGITKNAKKVGQQVSEYINTTQQMPDSTKIHEILSNTIGKKNASKIQITTDKESCIKALKEQICGTDDYAEATYESCYAMTIPIMGGKSLVNLKPALYKSNEFVNVSAHELEHAMTFTFSKEACKTRKLNKLRQKHPDLIKQNNEAKLNVLKYINAKNMALESELLYDILGVENYAIGLSNYEHGYSGLLKQTKSTSQKDIYERIRQILYGYNILEAGKNKANKYTIQLLKASIKDEKRAYSAGGSAERSWYDLCGTNPEGKANFSELNAMLHKDAVSVLNQELWHNRLNQLKEFFGITPSTKREDKIFEATKERLSL